VEESKGGDDEDDDEEVDVEEEDDKEGQGHGQGQGQGHEDHQVVVEGGDDIELAADAAECQDDVDEDGGVEVSPRTAPAQAPHEPAAGMDGEAAAAAAAAAPVAGVGVGDEDVEGGNETDGDGGTAASSVLGAEDNSPSLLTPAPDATASDLLAMLTAAVHKERAKSEKLSDKLIVQLERGMSTSRSHLPDTGAKGTAGTGKGGRAGKG
jgi:hypothetical protein